MAELEPYDIFDPADVWWTIDTAMRRSGLSRSSIERYVREGLPVYFRGLGGMVHRDEFLAERNRRIKNQRATRTKPKTA